MKARAVHTAALVFLVIALLAGSLGANAQGGGSAAGKSPGAVAAFRAGELLVRFRPDTNAASRVQVLTEANGRLIRTLYGSDVELWTVTEGQEQATAALLAQDPTVIYAEPNFLYRTAESIPNDPSFANQWAHARIRSGEAWNVTTGNATTVIAIIDTGIDAGHPDLAAKIVAGFDFVDGDNDPKDLNGHGTHCAGIAAAVTNNGVGIAGTDWHARIMPVRVLNQYGVGYNSAITEGIIWAYQHGARILSLSLAGPSFSQTMQDAVNQAHAAGSLVVAAMGNNRAENPTMYPAAYENVMAVAATGPDDAVTYYSQYGPHCDIAAPGGVMTAPGDPNGILSTMPTYSVYMNTQYGYATNYDYVQGTSQATPHVAGLAALIWAVHPAWGPNNVRTLIQTTAVDLGPLGWDADFGHGRIDAANAVGIALSPAAYLPAVLRSTATAPQIEIPNGDFEQGAVIWSQFSSGGWPLIFSAGSLPVPPHGGSWAAWLGGAPNELSYLQQQLTVPDSHPILSYWHWIASGDICGYDFARIKINGTAIETYDLCESSSTGDWLRHTVDLGAYRNQSVAIRIEVQTDSSLNSNLFIDDVTFSAVGAAGTPVTGAKATGGAAVEGR